MSSPAFAISEYPIMFINPTTVSQSRPVHRLPLHKLTGTITSSVSKWCRNVISRWTQRVQHGERDKGVGIDKGNKNLSMFLGNESDDVAEDEWDERAMLDIAEVVEELDVYKDSAKFDDASFYSDDSASRDSSDDEDEAPKVDVEEVVRLFWCSNDSTSFEDEVVKVSDKSECSDPEYSETWDSFADDTSSGEVFIPSVVEEINIFEGLFDDFNDSEIVVDSPEIVEGSFYSYHSSSWDSSWDSEDGAAGDGKSYDLDWLYPVVEQIYDIYLEL
ncbi:hypothetical protein M378DRAFT_13490 [Amanita muscaria Koide BX008]|uniref:Uncharacterized protein n=1 Tax=Amanita muscaria (strain Koide BX008) TaxID=946122 RepID=A0A0C2WYF1_AMAMK|nr:hypothetical protein M378DRAFT_13490 [Amanita muscaria Koide BX008]